MTSGEPILRAVQRAFDEDQQGAAAHAPQSEPATASPVRSARIDPLFSPVPEVRRRALAMVSRSRIGPDEAVALGRVMLRDPEPAHRWLAAQALAPVGARLPLQVIERALDDPDDRVRRAAVDLAVLKGPAGLSILVPHATARAWPASQLAALGALPGLLSGSEPPPREVLDRLLVGVAGLDPPPLPEERSSLAAVARAVGTRALASRLAGSVRVRLGAARLLLADGGPDALRAVAAMPEDGSNELARVKAAATSRVKPLRSASAQRSGPPVPARASSTPASSDSDLDDVTTALAGALGDPDPIVRAEARSALMSLPPAAVEDWVRRVLGGGGPRGATPALACAVAEHVPRPALAEPVLRVAVAVTREERGPYLRALRALAARPQVLEEAVRSLEAGARADAVRLAWQVGGRSVVTALGALLQDSAAAVRIAVLEAFAAAGDPSALDLARRLLQRDSSAAVRVAAVRTLEPAGDGKRAEALAAALHDPDPDVRATAVQTLPRGADGRFAPLLLAALRDDDEKVWRAAAAQLVRTADADPPSLWDAIRESPGERREALVSALEQTRSPSIARLALENARARDPQDRALAVELAARAGTREASAAILDGLVDPDPSVRRTAAASLATLRSPATIQSLARTLTDPKAEVRIEAVRALGLIDDDTVPGVLIDALKDPEIRVREMATDALVRRRSPSVAARLVDALHSPDLRRPAATVLARMGSAAIDPLIEVAIGPDRDASQAAGRLIERVAGIGRFVDSLASTDPEERLRAVRVLGTIGGSQAGDALLGALGDPDIRVRATAATSLGEMGERRAIAALRRMFLGDPVADVAAAAESSLVKLGSGPSDAAEATDESWLDVTEPSSPTIDLEGVGNGTASHGAEGGDEPANGGSARPG